ncbi:titin-like isoform X18 [Juglans regia]|uniref:Titin-like isoform X18 n=1 Tax=Juglans regia TaxID=51240 RepID=A0A6P9F0U9_JUGRE|nr:titin-like isoform X18 [Juglans regia]
MVLSEDEEQLQEGERSETGEETGREVKDKMPRSNDTEEGLLEDDTTKVYSTVHTGEKIVKPSFQVESPEEAASKSSGEDERNNTTVEEPHLSKQVHDGHGIQAIPREQIAEANVVFVTPKPIEEEMTKNHQDKENKTKNSREEDGCLKSIKEGNVNDLSQESIGVGPNQNFEDDKKETTNLSKGETFYEQQTASVRACERIALGTIHNPESLENIPGASKQEEGLQGDSEYLAPTEASANDEDKNASSAQVAEDTNDNRLAETTENSAKVIPQGEEDLQQGLQINESPENILGASLVKRKEGQQGEVENQHSTESSIENRDEVTSSIKNTEIGARVIGGEEETDHTLKNDEPGETDCEVESPGEVLDTAKQGNGLQGDDDNLVPPETSINKRDELTSSVKTFGDNHENNRLAEATENSAKTTPEGEDSEPPLQRDETGESIALETAHGVEIPKNISDLALVKQDKGLQEECEKITPPEAEIEKRHEDTSYNSLSEATENSVKATPEGQEDSEHALHKHETRESIALETNHGVGNPKNIPESALVKQEEVLQGEVENQYSTESSIENRDKETSSIKVAEDNDKNNRPVETTENHARVIQQGEEERDQVLPNDEPGETDREVESPGEVLDTVKQGNGLQGDDEKVVPPETSINKRDELISSVGMYGDNHENNRLEGEDSEPPLQRDETGESIALETAHGVEIPKNIPDLALVKQDKGLQAECEELASTEAEIEKGDGDTSYVKVTEDNYANNKLVEATVNSTKTTPEGEEDPETSIVLETAHGVEIPKNIPDLALVKQEEGLQAECEKIALPEAEIEKQHEDTSCVKVDEDKDVNNSLAEATENSAKATPEGQEDSEHALHEHETRESIALETYHGVESPKNIPDTALVKQEEVLQGEVENQYSTVSSTENRDEEMSSIKVAKDNDENNRPAETTENHARVVQQGDEETDHVLQNDESGETNCEAFQEILDTVKQGNYLQGDDDNLVPETSINKKDELTSSVEVFGDKTENNGQAEATENSAKTTPESEEDSGHALQRDETGESIAHEANHGVEGPKNTPDPALVKQEEGLQAECEKLAPTEAEIEKRQGDISYFKVAEDNNANNKLAEDTERNTKILSESGEDSYKVLLTDEPGQTIRGLTNHNVKSPENNLDSLLVKQGEGMQGESDNLGQTKTSIKVAEDEDNIGPVETTKNSIKVILKGEEDSEHVLQKDDPQQKPIQERNPDVEKPEENLDKSLVNQEEDLQVEGENLAPTEASMENKDEDIPPVKMVGHKAENNMQDEDRENSPKGTPKVEDSEHSLSKDAREIIGCEADREIEGLEKFDNSPLVNQEVFLQREGENLISKEASVERRDENTSYMKIAKGNDNDDNDGLAAEAADISVKATSKGEENLEEVIQKDEPGKQPEQLLDVVSEDKEAEYILEKMENTTLVKEEGIIQNLEETSEVEKKEETKTVDDKKEKEAAIEKVFNTTSFSEETGVQMAEEIHNVRDLSPEFNEKEITKENFIEEQQCGALETVASSTNTEKSVIDKPATAELPSSSDKKETVKESLKEEESDVMVLKEEAGGTTLEFIKQTDLTEKAKAETLQDCAGQSRDFTALTTIENYFFMPEVPVEEINEKLLKQEKNTIIDSDSASEAVVSELGLKETKPDNKEHVKSFDIVPEEKGLATIETGVSLDSVDIEVQSEENSKSEENMSKKIFTVADETGEKIEHQMEDKASTGGIDNELSLTSRETTLDGISEDGSRDSYIMPLQEHEPTTTEVGKIMEETSARDEIIDEIAKIPSSVQKTDEKLIQKEDESINPADASELLSSDDGKDGAIEELKHEDAELHMPPKQHIEKNSYETEDVEISKRGETSALADQTEVCKLESLEVENPSDDPSKPIAVGPYQGSDKTILEQGDFVQTEGILTGVLVEKGTTGKKTNVCSHECEPTNTKTNELLAEKNLESDDLRQKLVFGTESEAKDPSHETLPQTNKSQTEENSNDVQDWNFESVEPQITPQVQGKTETKMAMETKLKAEDHINVSPTTKETITTHTVTEGVHERIQEVDGSEGTKEKAIYGESELKEIHKVSAKDDIVQKVEDSRTKSSTYLEETDFSEQTETLTENIQETTRETKASGTKAPEEEKIQDEVSLKPVDVSTTEAEDTEETIKEKIKVEVDNILDEDDNVTVVPAESPIHEAHMDGKSIKETSPDESLETVTFQPCLQAEDVGSKKLPIEEVDGTEGIKEQAMHGEHGLKEIHRVSAKDDILQKVEDCGTKSSDYLEAIESSEQTVTVKANVQEPTMETELSGPKAPKEENIQDEVSLKPANVSTREAEDAEEKIKEYIEVEADNFLDEDDNATAVPTKSPKREAHKDDKTVKETSSDESVEIITIQPCPHAEEVGSKKLQIEEVDGSESIKEQAIHAESELKEIHKVSAKDDIVEKVDDCGTKSFDYLEETDSSDQTETVKAFIQEQTRETEAFGAEAPEEEKIQNKVSLKTVDVSETEVKDTKEAIKVKIKVEANNLFDEDDNATAVPAELPIREAHMDDKSVKETSSDESVETITIQPCPQAEEVGSKKLKIEEVDGSEGIKEQAIHGASELKEIHKVYAEDDILEKVENCGRKSSDYIQETDSSEQTGTFTADIQEPTRETEASGTKALEEEKIQDEVSLKPVEISTTGAEDTKETIKEEIEAEENNLIDEDGNAIEVPAESPIPEAHMNDKVVKETSSDESVETITIQSCPQAKVGSKRLRIEEVDGSEGIKKEAIYGESELKEIHKVHPEDDILEKVEDCGRKSSDYLEEIDSSEQIETLTADIQEPTRETEASGTKAPEEEKIQDEISLKPVEISTTEAEDTKEMIKEKIKVETDNFLDEDDNATAIPVESPIPEVHMDDKAIEEIRSDDSVETIRIQPCPQAEEVGSKKLRIGEVDGSEGTKEKAISGESELKEIHKVSTKDDIVEKVEDSGTKSSTYQEETDFSEQTETLTANIQETTRETKASGTKAPEEEKIQDEVSLKPVDVSTTEAEDTGETIKEKIKVEADNILYEDDNAIAVPVESPVCEAHTDDKAVNETCPDESLETVKIQPCPQVEDVGSKKLPIEEVDGTEGIKEQAMHGEQEFKEIHRVSAEDDILQKVEDSGRKSSDYQEETDSNEQTETLTTDIQEPTRETEASGKKASEEEKIQDEVDSLKPIEISTREAEDTKETIKEKIKVEADNFLDEDDNATAVPAKSPKPKAHMDDKAIKETRSEESVETITTQPCPHAEEVGNKKLRIEEVDGSEGTKEKAIYGERELKEIHKVSTKDDIVEKVEDSGTKSSTYLGETNFSEQIETLTTNIQETTSETEASGTKAPEEENIQDEVSLKPVDVSTTEVEDKEEMNKEKIKVEADNILDEDDNAIGVPAESPVREAHSDDKVDKETSLDESLKTVTIHPCPQAEDVGSKKLPIEEVDGTEGIKEQAMHGEQELKEIYRVSAEDDILQKVEDCGRKSSDYQEETDSNEQTKTLTTDIQEPTRETEASGKKAPEEEKIQDDVSLKPVEISTREAEDTKEMIKEKIKAEADNFLDEDDYATAIPAESPIPEAPIPEAHMDDKAIKETRLDESVETITTQPCPHAEEVGNKKHRIEEVDGSEGTKEKTIYGESELKEIHKVSTKDDIVEKVEDSGTKSSTYLEETDFSEQTETLTTNIQETTRETEASGTKAPEEEKIHDEVSLKPVDVSTTEAEDTEETIKEKIKVEADNILDEDDNAIAVPAESPVLEAHTDDKVDKETSLDESLETVTIHPCPQAEDVGSKKHPIEEVDGSEGIKEQAMHGEQELKEIHRVSAEDDILQKEEDCGRKSSDYQEETDSNEQTETLTTDIQEPTRETEASGKKAPEEEKIQDEMDSLKPIEISTREAKDTKETIKEKIKVEADNFHDEDDNATAVPAESPKPEAHMDDKAIKDTRSDESVETITTQPCPHAEEVGNKKLRIEEVDGSEGTKEKAIYGESELKEIHKVSTKDDIVGKVEDSGTKSSTYLEETDFSEQTETLTTNIQETTRETEASGTKAPEEEKIHDEVSLKPVDVSTTEAEDTEETIKEKIKVEADNILDEDDNAIAVPAESPVREAHTDDKVDKETSLDESLETVTIHPCPQAEDVGSKKLPIEEVDGSEGIKEQAMHGEQELKEIHRVSAEDDILQKEEDCGRKSSDYQEETDSNEQTETLTTDIQEPTRETEASGKKAPEEEKIQDKVSLKPVEISTREAEDTKEMIKENIKVEADNFLDEDDNATAVPAESPIPEAHMDDKAIKETRSDDSIETITIQPCPHAEEVGSKKLRIEEVDGSEGTKEKAIYGESELKEIHKVSTKDDIVEKVEDSGTKSSTYLEETDFSEQTETLTTNIQETTRETEASGTKAPEEEKIHDEVSLKPVDVSTTEAEDTEETIKEKIKVEADNILDEDDNAIAVPAESPVREAHTDDKVDKETSLDESLETVTIHPCPQAEDVGSKKLPIEEVDGSEGIKEQAMHGEQELKEIHRVSAEDDILQKEEDCGRKSSDYQEETDSNEQTETLTTDIQEPTRETEASGKKAPEEEKIQDKVSLKPVEISTREAEDTKEMIKENIKVEADNFLDEDDNATAVPAESPIPEAHMDDKAIKETRSDDSIETITIQPCPHAEEVGSKKLRIEEVDGSEGTKEKAIYGESELKEIHKVSTKDDIVEKVEDSGTKSSTYLEETDFSEQTETLTTNIQETTRETEASGTKAPEEEKIHDEVSLKPVDVSTTEAEDTEETIKEKIKVEADNILDEDDNAIVVPAESPVCEAHTDDKAVNETCPNKSLETVTIQPCPQVEDVDSKKLPIEEVDGSEGIKGLAMHGERELKEIHRVSAEDDILQKVEDCGTKSSNYLEATDPSEQTATVKANIQEQTVETELSGTKALEEENIQDEVSLKPANLSTREAKDAEEKIKEYTEVEADKFLDENDNASAVPAESCMGEAHMDLEAVKEISSDESLEIITIENIRLEQDEPMVHKNEEKESVTQGKPGADEVEDVKTSPSAVVSSKYLGVEETQETGQSLRVEKLDSDRSEEGIKEDSGTMSEAKSLGIEMVTQGEMTSGQTLPTGNLEEEFQTPSSALLSLEREHGPTTVVKEAEATKIMEEEIINDSLATKATEETCLQNKEQLQTLSSALLSKEQEHEAQTAFKKTEEESTKEVESLDDKNINNFSAIKESEETGLEQEGPMDPEHVEKESATLEKQDTDEVEVTKTVSREQEHGTTTAGERTEEEEMKGAKMIGDESIDNSSAAKTTEGTCLKTKEHMELEVSTLGLESSKATHRGSSNEVQEEEGSKLDQASKLEPHEKEEMKYDDSPSGVQSHQVLPKSEDMKEKHLETAMTDLNAEESQCKETAEEDQIFKNRVSMEEVREVVEEKEVAKDSQSVSPGDETIIESHQGDELKAVACPEEETNKTFKATTNANQHEALKLPELIDKDSASENIEKKITAEESSYLNEAEGKNIEEAVSELDLDYKSGETHITKEKTEVIALSEKEAGVEISQKEGTAGFSEVNEITEDIQQLEKNSYAASEIKIPGEEEPSGNKEAAFITDNEDVLPVLQHPIDKALQKVELEHERPGKATEVDAEERGIECEGEKRMGGSGEINKESASVDSAKMSSSDLMQGSMKKNLQAAKNLTKEREPMPSKAKIQNEGAETTQIDKARADEEEGDEHKRSEPDSDSPVMVEASKDTEAKVPHKKSHNILSGVGSKVKHSISKVKKAITGKSSHPKTSLPK